MLIKTSQALLNHYDTTRLLTLSHQNVQSPALTGLTFQSKWENITAVIELFMSLHAKAAYNKNKCYNLLHTWANLTEMCCYNKSLSFLKWFLSGIQKANGFIKCFTLQISSIVFISRSTKVCHTFGQLPHQNCTTTLKTLTAASSSPADVSQIDVS